MDEANIAPDDWVFWQRRMNSIGTKGYVVPIALGSILGFLLLWFSYDQKEFGIGHVFWLCVAAALVIHGVRKYKTFCDSKQKYEEARKAARR